MAGFLKNLFAAFSPPKPTGPPELIMRIGEPAPNLISDNASWTSDCLVVKSDSAETVRLLELPLKSVDQCRLELRFEMSSNDVQKSVYPEIWVRVEGVGECFSKGLNNKLKGSNGWTSCQLPFLLRENQNADLIKFNLVFEGTGSASIRNIELYSTPIG